MLNGLSSMIKHMQQKFPASIEKIIGMVTGSMDTAAAKPVEPPHTASIRFDAR